MQDSKYFSLRDDVHRNYRIASTRLALYNWTTRTLPSPGQLRGAHKSLGDTSEDAKEKAYTNPPREYLTEKEDEEYLTEKEDKHGADQLLDRYLSDRMTPHKPSQQVEYLRVLCIWLNKRPKYGQSFDALQSRYAAND